MNGKIVTKNKKSFFLSLKLIFILNFETIVNKSKIKGIKIPNCLKLNDSGFKTWLKSPIVSRFRSIKSIKNSDKIIINKPNKVR